jgi:hypothetical protein
MIQGLITLIIGALIGVAVTLSFQPHKAMLLADGLTCEAPTKSTERHNDIVKTVVETRTVKGDVVIKTETIDKTVVEKQVSIPTNYLITATRTGYLDNVEFGIMVSKRALGPVFIGAGVDNRGMLQVGITVEF